MTLIPRETERRSSRDVLRFIARCEDPDAPLEVNLGDPSSIEALGPELLAVLAVAEERETAAAAHVRWLESLIDVAGGSGETEREQGC